MSWRILILEDDASLRKLVASILEDQNYIVFEAGDSDEALVMVDRHDPHLMITDVRMAGQDGLATLSRLLEFKPGLRSIVITGYADESAPARAVQAQTSDYLRKPFTMQELVDAVSRVLGAEQEQQRYNGLLDRFIAGYKTLLTAVSDAQFKSLEKDRDRAFQAFFVSVRSRQISEAEAVEIWSHILMLESERDHLKSGGIDLALRQKLAEGYRSIPRALGTLARPQPLEDPALPVQRLRFLPLLHGLEEGRISVEQLKLAPLLQGLRYDALGLSPDLQSLHRTLWGPT